MSFYSTPNTLRSTCSLGIFLVVQIEQRSPGLAAGRRLWDRLCFLFRFGEGNCFRLARGINPGEQLDFPLGLLQQVMAVAKMLDPQLVTGKRFRQPQVAVLQVVDDGFEAGQGGFEGGWVGRWFGARGNEYL